MFKKKIFPNTYLSNDFIGESSIIEYSKESYSTEEILSIKCLLLQRANNLLSEQLFATNSNYQNLLKRYKQQLNYNNFLLKEKIQAQQQHLLVKQELKTALDNINVLQKKTLDFLIKFEIFQDQTLTQVFEEDALLEEAYELRNFFFDCVQDEEQNSIIERDNLTQLNGLDQLYKEVNVVTLSYKNHIKNNSNKKAFLELINQEEDPTKKQDLIDRRNLQISAKRWQSYQESSNKKNNSNKMSY